MLEDAGAEDGGSLLRRRPRTAELLDRVGGLPLLEDVDATVVDGVGGEVEVDAARRAPRGDDDLDARVEVGLTLQRVDVQRAGHDDHRAILACRRRAYGVAMSDNQQVKVWNELVGATWATHADHFDATLEPFGEAVLASLAVRPHERVVDIGCGAGATTLRLAAAADPATVVGVDVSQPMLATAAARAAAAGVTNISFSETDVEAHPLGSDVFDVAFSRFGVMFFADPVRAFANVRASLTPGGRLGFVCFQMPWDNPFILVPTMAAAAHLQMGPPPPLTEPGPFSLADPEHTRTILSAAGFDAVSIEAGPTSAVLGAADDLVALGHRVLEQNPGVAAALAVADPDARAAAIHASAEALAPHASDGVVRMAAATWIVTATAGE